MNYTLYKFTEVEGKLLRKEEEYFHTEKEALIAIAEIHEKYRYYGMTTLRNPSEFCLRKVTIELDREVTLVFELVNTYEELAEALNFQ